MYQYSLLFDCLQAMETSTEMRADEVDSKAAATVVSTEVKAQQVTTAAEVTSSQVCYRQTYL